MWVPLTGTQHSSVGLQKRGGLFLTKSSTSVVCWLVQACRSWLVQVVLPSKEERGEKFSKQNPSSMQYIFLEYGSLMLVYYRSANMSPACTYWWVYDASSKWHGSPHGHGRLTWRPVTDCLTGGVRFFLFSQLVASFWARNCHACLLVATDWFFPGKSFIPKQIA